MATQVSSALTFSVTACIPHHRHPTGSPLEERKKSRQARCSLFSGPCFEDWCTAGVQIAMGYQGGGNSNGVKACLQSSHAKSTQSTFQSDAATNARVTTPAVSFNGKSTWAALWARPGTTTKNHNGRVVVGVTSHKTDHTGSIQLRFGCTYRCQRHCERFRASLMCVLLNPPRGWSAVSCIS